jgi:D-3-phosphoglycerate dehydrogenase
LIFATPGLGILGLGNVGIGVAKIGRAFGMNVIAWSENLTQEKTQKFGVERVSKEDLFRNSDFLTVHLILTQRKRGIVSKEDFALMKISAFLINSSRGPIVDGAALVDVLQENRIAGAAVDTFTIEPLP